MQVTEVKIQAVMGLQLDESYLCDCVLGWLDENQFLLALGLGRGWYRMHLHQLSWLQFMGGSLLAIQQLLLRLELLDMQLTVYEGAASFPESVAQVEPIPCKRKWISKHDLALSNYCLQLLKLLGTWKVDLF